MAYEGWAEGPFKPLNENAPRIWKLKLHTGPTEVKHWAAKFRDAGINTVEGTEHIIITIPDSGDGWGAIGAYAAACEVAQVNRQRFAQFQIL